MNAKTVKERVTQLRDRRAELGLERHDVYVHPDDWGAVKALVEKLKRKRELQAAKKKA